MFFITRENERKSSYFKESNDSVNQFPYMDRDGMNNLVKDVDRDISLRTS